MDQETQEFAANAKAFAASVSDLEALLLPLFAVPFDELVVKSEDLIDRASLCVLFSYIINTLAFLYLRTQGATKGHPVRKELQSKKKKKKKRKKGKANNPNPAPTQLDQNAAKRFIKHTLSNNPEIKEKYKEEERSAQAEQFLDSILATQESSNSANVPAVTSSSTPSAGQKRVRNDGDDDSSSRKRSQKKTPKKSPKLK
ncbi:hypothetical protein BDR26DRAFT_873108 [Obelidium mucronatum]|nr:hypothetical protein BDR26DRAFT_873108 [Obelidium mucronatum]